MNVKVIAILIIFINNFGICQSIKYNNYSLFNIVPTEADHLQFLQNLDHQKYIDVIFWKKPYKLYESVQLIVHPADRDLFLERVMHYKLTADLLIEDIQRAFDNQIVQRFFEDRVDPYSWRSYHTLDYIYHWLKNITEEHSKLVKLTSITKSVQGRDIFVISSTTKSLLYPKKLKVIVEGGIHGNEWISVEFVTYLMDQLIRSNEKKSGLLGQLFHKYEWHFIPIVNPDGYEYSHTDRLWRKNRRRTGRNTVGVDLDRNFNYSFGRFGTSSDEKDDTYCGAHAFSEPESKGLADFIEKNKKGLKYYFSFHAYGEKIIIPYADTLKHIDNYAETEKYSKQVVSKIYRIHGIKYSVGTHYDTLGLRISGNSASYVKHNHNVSYVYTFHLRDNGSYGYALPSEQILPTCEETLPGIIDLLTAQPRNLKQAGRHIFNNGQRSKGCIITVFIFISIIIVL